MRGRRAPGLAEPATRFEPPPARSEAGEPPERRGMPRDAVRLLVSGPDGVAHHRFRDLPELLEPGDLVVVNTSATVAAALDARRADGLAAPVHVSAALHEPPPPERFTVAATTSRLVNDTRAAGRRIVAVGTTTVRALKSAADDLGNVHPVSGWTALVLGPDRPARVVDALIAGLHSPEASHLLLLEAVAGGSRVGAAYAAAVEEGYLWHELGDAMLFVSPSRTQGP